MVAREDGNDGLDSFGLWCAGRDAAHMERRIRAIESAYGNPPTLPSMETEKDEIARLLF